MKNSEIIRHLNGLEIMSHREQKAIECNPDYPRMNIRAVYKISQNKQVLKNALEPYKEALKSLLAKYNVMLNPDGNIYLDNIDEEQRNAFTFEVDELLNLEADIVLSKIVLDDFGNYEISQADYEALEFMID